LVINIGLSNFISVTALNAGVIKNFNLLLFESNYYYFHMVIKRNP
jgi:hypothetical protein